MKPRPFRPGTIQPAGGPLTWRYDSTRLLPTITCYLHLSQDAIIRDRHGVARWEDEGPVTVQFVREHLAPYQHFHIHPVIDLENQAPADAYEIPDRHRRAVRLLTPADSYPFSANPDHATKQVDHTIAYVPMEAGGRPGQSRIGNYGPMSQLHHLIKTFGPIEVRQPFPGIYIWRDQYHQYFLVDHTGTRRINDPPHREVDGETGDQPRRSTDRAGPTDHWGHGGLQLYLDRDPIDYEHTHTAS
jgi:hypothetical protein